MSQPRSSRAPVSRSEPSTSVHSANGRLLVTRYAAVRRPGGENFAALKNPFGPKVLPMSPVRTEDLLAERGGFEPPVDFKGLRRFSKPLLSTTQPPLRSLWLLRLPDHNL